MSLLVVIVNYRTPALTVQCLRSLEPQVAGLPGTRVVVTDCASGDDSVETISLEIAARGWQSWASVMPLLHNGGFAFGNNAVIRPALRAENKPDYILLLNPDTIARPGALAHLVDFMGTWPHVGIAGSRLEDPDGRPQRSAFRFPSVASEFEGGIRVGVVSRLLERSVVAPPVPEGRCQVDWVAGASMIVRREVFEQVGLLDEAYFMYYEEVDFCLRARKAGWTCWYVPASRVVHLIGQASGVTDVKAAQKKRRPPYWFASRRRYFLKHLGPARTLLADVAWATGHGVHQVLRAARFRRNTDPPRLWRDFVKYNFFIVPRVSEFQHGTAGVRHSTLPPTSVFEQPLSQSPPAPPPEAAKAAAKPVAGSVDATSALWAALKRDAARHRPVTEEPAPPEPSAAERLRARRAARKAEAES